MGKIFILVLNILCVTTCGKKDTPVGKWADIIKLSTKDAVFTAAADSIIITTKGDWWWINAITFEDSTYTYIAREDINLESDSYAIKENDFVIERRDKNTLFIKLNKNTTRATRKMKIELQAGNYFDSITIKQKAK